MSPNPELTSVSVVIRNRNESNYLVHVLKALAKQSRPPHEVILVDNESTDSSRELAVGFGAKIVPISKADFTFGGALNKGIAAATGDVVLVLSAHSLPLGAHFIEDGLSSMVTYDAAAACSLDVRSMDNRYNWWEPHVTEGAVQWKEIWDHTTENRAAFLRRDLCGRFPFREDLESSEDRQWSADVLAAGYRIVTAPVYFWYMRRQSLAGGIREFERAMVSMRRIGGDIGSFPLAPVIGRVAAAWKLAVRTTIDEVMRFMVFRKVPKLAARAAKTGSVR